MYGVDQQRQRLFYRTVGIRGGLDLSTSLRNLGEGTSPNMMNMLVRSQGLEPSKAPSTTAFTLDEIVKGSAHFMGTVSWLILLGTTKCWVKSVGAPVEKTPATPFSNIADPLWHGFSMMHGYTQVVVVHNSGTDRPHYWDGGSGNFLEITEAPKARTYIGYLGRLMAGAVYDEDISTWCLNRVAWSADGDITVWPLTGSSGYQDLKDEGDVIMRLWRAQSNVLRILRRRSVWTGIPTFDPYIPFTPQYVSSDGIFAVNTLQDIGQDSCVYMGEKDIFLLANTTQPVGRRIRDELFSLADPARLQYAWSFVDTAAKEYYLVVDLLDGTTRAYILNYEDLTWTRQDVTGIKCLIGWYED